MQDLPSPLACPFPSLSLEKSYAVASGLNVFFNVTMVQGEYHCILEWMGIDDERPSGCAVISNSSCLKTLMWRSNLLVNQVLMYQLQKLFVALKKFLDGKHDHCLNTF